jgi:hypothetical protein
MSAAMIQSSFRLAAFVEFGRRNVTITLADKDGESLADISSA